MGSPLCTYCCYQQRLLGIKEVLIQIAKWCVSRFPKMLIGHMPNSRQPAMSCNTSLHSHSCLSQHIMISIRELNHYTSIVYTLKSYVINGTTNFLFSCSRKGLRGAISLLY